MSAVTHAGRVYAPLAVHDALRRGKPDEAVSLLRDANPGLGRDEARQAVQRLAANPSDPLDHDDPFRLTGSDVPTASDTLPSAVAAKIATGNTLDAARRLRDAKPGLSDAEAREAVARHCSPLLRKAREETVVEGDSRRYGWLAWVAALVIVGSGLAIWLG
ncbi:hypothetical protein CMZ82_05900 [Lysobacteraceae bacterium NML93-0792]|nr:hypothetical protein CMZ82_05900 [Xanthomonadaceae bacterium NML93-0792]PBS16795.1 hypothetical protein CMZ81_03650 [Xanthomonadaceae bacterium NML93-0793]PBS19392.1 hypothetical protein CMZ80_06770 [Xanthomonadaceae bacterium NML93-0831]